MDEPAENGGEAGKLERQQAQIAYVLALFGAIIAFTTYWFCWSRVAGKIQSRGGQLGTWEFVPEECVSGDRYRPAFFGVDLLSKSQGGMRLRFKQFSKKRSSLVVWIPGDEDRYFEFERASCASFTGVVDDMAATVNQFRSMKGNLSANCEIPGVGHIEVNATFAACH